MRGVVVVAGEPCTSRLCSSNFPCLFFPFHLLGILRLFIIFFYVHTFDDAWYADISSSNRQYL